MRSFITVVAVSGLAAAMGCGDDTTAAGGNGGTSSEGGGGNNPTTGGEGTGASPNGGNGTGGAGGQSPECPSAGGDTTCDTCAKDSCCAAYEACLADDSCATCFACTQAADDPTTCLGNECDVEQPEEAALISCAYEGCRSDCFGGQSICNPAPEDTECVTCAKAAGDADPPGCCEELEGCVVDEVCLRCLGCVVTALDPVQECTSVCQFGNGPTGELLSCAAFPRGSCTPVCNP